MGQPMAGAPPWTTWAKSVAAAAGTARGEMQTGAPGQQAVVSYLSCGAGFPPAGTMHAMSAVSRAGRGARGFKVLLALLAAAGGTVRLHADADDDAGGEEPPLAAVTTSASEDSGFPEPPTAREIILTAPIAAPRLSFFHSALEVPPLESARNLPVGAVEVQVETSHARSIEREEENGIENRFDGFFHEWLTLDVRAGVLPRLELGARGVYAGWDEQIDRFRVFDSQGNIIVRDENVPGAGASKRHENVSKLVLHAKTPLLLREEAYFDVGFLSSIKIPIGRERDLTNAGTTDLNFVLLSTVPVGPLAFHFNFGLGVPLGHQNLFTHEADVKLDPFFHGGAAAVWTVTDWLALDVQFEGNESAFGDVEFLDGPVYSFVPGFRLFFGPVSFEAAGGLPLSRQSYEFLVHFALAYTFGAERRQAHGRWSAGG